MNLLFLRGPVPSDRNPKEIVYNSLEESDDMWEHLASYLGDRVEIVYWGGKYYKEYSDRVSVRWVPNLDCYKPSFEPNLIFARGGFYETYGFVKRFNCQKIYYGSGARFKPNHDLFDLILVDSLRQLEAVGGKGRLWVKPAAPLFRPVDTEKKYDICFVGDGRFPFRNKIKRVNWTYKHAPMDMSFLHLGWPGDKTPPINFTVKRVKRKDMPKYYSQCKIGICPYNDYDSAPRVIPEMIACRLPVVVMDTVHFWENGYGINGWSKDVFWDTVRSYLNKWDSIPPPYSFTHDVVSVSVAANSIRRMLDE